MGAVPGLRVVHLLRRGCRLSAGTALMLLLSIWNAAGEPVRLGWTAAGAGPRMSPVRPRTVDLSPARPAGIRRLPANAAHPLFGFLTMGPEEAPSRFAVLLDAPPGRPSRLYVDSNGNGDFTDDPRPEWQARTYLGSGGRKYWESVGGATVQVGSGASRLPFHISLERFDSSDPARAGFHGAILYTPDYAREGEIRLGSKRYHAMLLDALAGGDYRGMHGRGATGIFLLIDVNGNGIIDARGEIFDSGQPFTISGTTYELRGVTASGDRAEIVESARRVPEIPPPPDLRIGKIVPPFEKKASSGGTVRFPGAYRGKMVMLLFWATWCGDCQRTMPRIARLYRELHPAGLEIIGVSLDHANALAELTEYTRKNDMPWPEIYDGNWMQAEVARLYFVHRIPTAILVDGNSGAVEVNGQDLTDDQLISKVRAALARRRLR